jgi:hypothetical protein
MSRNELLLSAFAVFVVIACALTAGCSVSHGPGSGTASNAADAPIVTPGAADPSSAPSAADLAEVDSDEVVTREAFKPPFAGRRELFLPPQKPVDVPSGEQVEGSRVELKGFVNLDRQKALLWVDGVVTPVAEGESRGDVQVISINPPRVIFQRGAHRWTESLFTPQR